MPWVRIDEHAMSHRKLRALSDGAFRLWVEGLAHCQRHLTNGAISSQDLRNFRYKRSRRVAELCTSVEGAPPLWIPTGDGFTVHDYLIWNDDREIVLARRSKARERMQRLRAGSPERSGARSGARSDERAANVRDSTPHQVPQRSKPVRSRSAKTALTGRSPKEPATAGEGIPDTEEVDPANAAAGAFIRAFCDLYSKHRHGAKYLVVRLRDVPLVKRLLRTYPATRLMHMATALLTTEDEWIAETDRGIGILSTKATWLDSRLAEYEAEHGAFPA